MKNLDVRLEIAAAGLLLWQIADNLGIADTSFSRKLRKELSDNDKEKIRTAIQELKVGGKDG